MALAQHPTLHILCNNNNNLSILFRALVSNAKDESIKSISVFY